MECEIEKVELMDELPDNWTYPLIQPKLIEKYLQTERQFYSQMQLRNTWEHIINDDHHHLIVCEIDGRLVASCVCVIIPNLTRNVRPYAFVENVVTHGDYRKKGYATLRRAWEREPIRIRNKGIY